MNSLKILIIEDDLEDAEIIQYVLLQKLAKCEFTVVENKDTFINVLNNFQPDVILSDHSMPRFRPQEALKISRQKYPGIPFIVVAGIVPEEFVVEIMKLGADDYIIKGKIKELPAAIEKATKLYRSAKEKEEVAAQLEISERNYHTVFLQSPFPKWIFDSETKQFLEVNEAAVSLYGYSREEFLSMTLRDIRTKEGKELLEDYFKKPAFGSGTQPSFWQHLKKNGELIDVEVNSHSITYNDRPARMAIIIDITERRKAEQQILQSEANLKSIFENTSDGFMLLDRNANIMVFNNNAEIYNVFSHNEKFQLGHCIYDYIPKERKDYFQNILETVLGGTNIQYDRSFTMQNGSTHWIEFSVTPVIVANEIKGVCFTGHDITEKKRIEQEREFDRNNLKALINNTNDLMWSLDRDFRLITSNEAFDATMRSLLGSSMPRGGNLMNKKFDKGQRDRFKAYYERAFLGESFTETEYMGQDAWSDISFYPIYNGAEIIGAACYSRDISWQKKADKERAEYAKSLEEMLFKISHQVRVPIANLLGMAHVFEFSDASDKDLKEIASFIRPTVSTLDAFSRDLSDFIQTRLVKKTAETEKHNEVS
jgi:PAS domain S-box-containing protein